MPKITVHDCVSGIDVVKEYVDAIKIKEGPYHWNEYIFVPCDSTRPFVLVQCLKDIDVDTYNFKLTTSGPFKWDGLDDGTTRFFTGEKIDEIGRMLMMKQAKDVVGLDKEVSDSLCKQKERSDNMEGFAKILKENPGVVVTVSAGRECISITAENEYEYATRKGMDLKQISYAEFKYLSDAIANNFLLQQMQETMESVLEPEAYEREYEDVSINVKDILKLIDENKESGTFECSEYCGEARETVDIVYADKLCEKVKDFARHLKEGN